MSEGERTTGEEEGEGDPTMQSHGLLEEVLYIPTCMYILYVV